MDEELYRLVTTGLLGLIVLLLVLAIARLGNLQRGSGATSAAEPSPAPAVADTSGESTDSAAEEPRPLEESADSGGPGEEPEEAPFERDGRWWYRRGGELLVYDERVEQWVDPAAANTETGQSRAPEPSRPAPYESPEPVGMGVYDSPKVGGAPEQHPLDEAKGWDATPSTHAPIEEPVSPPQPITENVDTGPAEGQAPADSELGSHWKCPACGVINGSTATSCRMCFAARP